MVSCWGCPSAILCAMRADVAAAHAALNALSGRSVEAAEFSSRVGLALRRVLSFDGWCLFGVDPDNGLRTSQFGGRGTENTAEMARNESLMTDVNRWGELATASVPFGVLDVDHPGARRSFRLHEVLLRQGFHSELRLALRDRGRFWGGLTLFREDPRRRFSQRDAQALFSLSTPLTHALRGYSLRRLTGQRRAPASGVVTLSHDNTITAMSPQAQAWLDDLVPGGDDETYVTDVTRVLFDAAHALRRGEPHAATNVRTVSGHWLRVEATPLDSRSADVAVVLAAPAVHQLLDTLSTYNGLTARESQILRLLAEGLAAKHIARELAIATATVNGHLTALYTKCRVAGRDELLGQLV